MDDLGPDSAKAWNQIQLEPDIINLDPHHWFYSYVVRKPLLKFHPSIANFFVLFFFFGFFRDLPGKNFAKILMNTLFQQTAGNRRGRTEQCHHPSVTRHGKGFLMDQAFSIKQFFFVLEFAPPPPPPPHSLKQIQWLTQFPLFMYFFLFVQQVEACRVILT
jgi:hypothetical protein